VTVIVMDRGVDSGDILLQEEFPIGPEDTYDTLHDRLAEEGARLLVEAVEGVVKGTAKRTTQDHTLATYAPRLKKEDCHIDWNADVKDIVNLIRGLSSSPGAYAYLRDKQVKIFCPRGKGAKGRVAGGHRPSRAAGAAGGGAGRICLPPGRATGG